MKKWQSPIWGKHKVHLRISIGRAKGDPEKTILPCIIWISSEHPKYKEFHKTASARSLSIGWWDWGINFGLYWSK